MQIIRFIKYCVQHLVHINIHNLQHKLLWFNKRFIRIGFYKVFEGCISEFNSMMCVILYFIARDTSIGLVANTN